jgi:hypothetical protein
VKPIYQVVQDLEHAARKGQLTPTYIEVYADRHGERVAALYALAARNLIAVDHEAGRNDHVLTEWEGSVDVSAVLRAMEDNSVEVQRELRAAREDGRPYALRKPTRHALYVVKPGGATG